MYESAYLLVDRHFVRGILYVLTPLVASVGAAWLGWALAH
jgi:fluoride ion exporter CrcB/FEX